MRATPSETESSRLERNATQRDHARTGASAISLALNGPPVALNCDLIERAEATPDTVLTLVDGTKYIVADTVEEIVRKVREFRASVLVLAQQLDVPEPEEVPSLRVLPDPEGMA